MRRQLLTNLVPLFLLEALVLPQNLVWFAILLSERGAFQDYTGGY